MTPFANLSKLVRRMLNQQADPAQNVDPDPNASPANNDNNTAEIESLRTQLAEAQAATQQQAQAMLETTRQAYRLAAPELPDGAFTGDTLPTLTQNFELARSVAVHLKETGAVNGKVDATPGTPPPISPRQPSQPAATLRGVEAIAYALRNPGKGNTEE